MQLCYTCKRHLHGRIFIASVSSEEGAWASSDICLVSSINIFLFQWTSSDIINVRAKSSLEIVEQCKFYRNNQILSKTYLSTILSGPAGQWLHIIRDFHRNLQPLKAHPSVFFSGKQCFSHSNCNGIPCSVA